MQIVDLPEPLEFEWDEANSNKIRLRHRLTTIEAEQPFFHENTILLDDKHSTLENRFHLVGKNNYGQVLFLVFTIRKNKIRIISARRASKKERSNYGQTA